MCEAWKPTSTIFVEFSNSQERVFREFSLATTVIAAYQYRGKSGTFKLVDVFLFSPVFNGIESYIWFNLALQINCEINLHYDRPQLHLTIVQKKFLKYLIRLLSPAYDLVLFLNYPKIILKFKNERNRKSHFRN